MARCAAHRFVELELTYETQEVSGKKRKIPVNKNYRGLEVGT